MQKMMVTMLALALLLTAGCEQVENLKGEFCEKLDQVSEHLDSLEDVDAESKVDDLRATNDKLGTALDALDATGIDLGLGSVDRVKAAHDDLEQRLDEAEASGDTAAAAAEIKEAVATLRAEYEKLQEQVCGSDN